MQVWIRLGTLVIAVWTLVLVFVWFIQPTLPIPVRSGVTVSVTALAAVIAVLANVAQARGLLDQGEDSHRKSVKEPRKTYLAFLSRKYQRLELTGLPLVDWEDRILPLRRIFVPPRLARWTQDQNPDQMSLGQILARLPRCVILGETGIGKSVLLQYLTLTLAEEDKLTELNLTRRYVPFLIPIRDFIEWRAAPPSETAYSSQEEAHFPFFEYMYARASEAGVRLPDGFFWSFVERGDCVVGFDGLDEVIDAKLRLQIRDLIAQFAEIALEKNSANRIIVTARLADYSVAPLYQGEFEHLVLSSFTHAQIATFVGNWYALREPSVHSAQQKAENLLHALANPRAQRLAANPLFLMIMALMHRGQGELPNQRTTLYERVTAAVFMRDRARGLSDSLADELKKRDMERIAWWLQNHPDEIEQTQVQVELVRRIVSEDKLNASSAEIQASQVMGWAINRGSLLRITRGNKCEFSHRSFQEYFAACDVFRRYSNALQPDLDVVRSAVMQHLHDPGWRETHLFLVTQLMPTPATQILREVLRHESEYSDLYPRDLVMALLLLAEDARVDADLRRDVLDELWAAVFTHKLRGADWRSGLWRRLLIQIVEILPSFRGSICEPLLLARLLEQAGDERQTESARSKAIEWLGFVGNSDEGVVQLLVGLLSDESPTVQDSSRIALTRLGQNDQKVVTRLVMVAQDKSLDQRTRIHASRALIHLHEAKEVTLLVAFERVRSTSRSAGRRIVADADLVREWARWYVEPPYRAGSVSTTRAVEIIADASHDASPRVREQAVWVAGKLRLSSRNAVNAIIELTHDVDGRVREQSFWALSRLTRWDRKVKKALKRGLSDVDERARKQAQRSYARLMQGGQ